MASALRDVWKRADAVCFDVDSTVITEEGIDELAKHCGKASDVSKLTVQAMTGAMTYRESLTLRLAAIRPSISQVESFVKNRPPQLTPGVQKLIDTLHECHTPVYLISGGFHSIITPIANLLKIPLCNVHANRLKFYYTGEYAGFEENEPTSRNGGKQEVIDMLKQKYGYQNLVLIGDGATDLEACPPADAFIGFGGNVVRENVKSKAEWFITDFQQLIDL